MRKTGTDKTCANCGKAFYVPAWRETYSEVKFCSMECLWAGRKPRAKKAKIEVFCEECGKSYLVESHRASKTRFCSFACRGAVYFREMNAAKRPPVASHESLKICSICGEEKPRSEFYARPESESLDGLRSDCKACHDARHQEWISDPINHSRKIEVDRAYHEREAERVNREFREWYASMTEEEKSEWAIKAKEWRDKNAEYLKKARKEKYWADPAAARARRRDCYLKNKPKYIAAARAREEYIKQATPPWANLKAIEKFYIEAYWLTQKTGVKHHVDHFYPLQSKVMCGLHVETNLQVITMEANLLKSNSIPEPDAMPRRCAWPTAAFLPGALDDVGSTA